MKPASTKKTGTRSTSTKRKAPPGHEHFDERDRTIAWVIRTLHRLYTAKAQDILDEDKITIAHWYYLRVLATHGRLTQLELSRRVGIASNTAVPALENMERMGLVTRARDPDDRRKHQVELTERGRALVDKLLPRMVDMLGDSIAGASADEVRTFWKMLHLVESNLRDEADGGFD